MGREQVTTVRDVSSLDDERERAVDARVCSIFVV
jgi:hypothetical protein